MKKKILSVLAVIAFALPFLSFIPSKDGNIRETKQCPNVVSIYAQGVTILNETISVNGAPATIYYTTIAPGTHQDFSSSAFTSGAAITVTVAVQTASAAPRLNSLEIGDPFQCVKFANKPGGSITGTKQCAQMQVIASNATECP